MRKENILENLEMERIKLYQLLDNPEVSFENILHQSKILDILVNKVQKKNLSSSLNLKDKS